MNPRIKDVTPTENFKLMLLSVMESEAYMTALDC